MLNAICQAAPSSPCTICGHETARLFEKEGYWIRACPKCGHRHAEISPDPEHVARVYGDEYFFGGGAGYANYLRGAELMRARGRWYARLLRRYGVEGSALDAGAAAGFFLQGLIDDGWDGHGIEPNPSMAEYGRKRLGLAISTGTLENFRAAAPFDLVCLMQVLNHFVGPRRALEAAAGATKTGGYWLIESWDRDSWAARILGRHWHEYSPPSVLHWFSLSGLDRLAADFGFRRIARGRPLKLIKAEHAKSLVQHKFRGSALERAVHWALKVVPDRLTIRYPPEDLFWALYRKSDRFSENP